MDPILYWNTVALDANRADFSGAPPDPEQGGPTLSSRALAIVHLAMYDAYAGARGNPTAGANTPALPPYQVGLPVVPAGASPAAAVAEAARVTLTLLYPRQRSVFEAAFGAAQLGSGAGVDAGLSWGRTVALRLMALRSKDPSASGVGHVYDARRGHHRPDPVNSAQGVHAPFYGARSSLFAATSRHRLDPFPELGTPAYLADVREVKAKGIAPELAATVPSNQRRTPDETLFGIFWAYDGVNKLGTPPRLYNQIVRGVAAARLAAFTATEQADNNARLFALVNVAMGDAGILAWEEKYIHDLWRPVVGIREHDGSMGPAATAGANPINNDCDTQWLPLGAPRSNSYTPNSTPPPTGAPPANFTPNFPAYPSGHATFGAAAFHITRRFFGVSSGDTKRDDLADGLTFVSEECNGVTTDNHGVTRPKHVRSFQDGLWDMIIENSASRVYLGVHWRFDGFTRKSNGKPDIASNIGGVPLGLHIADDVFNTGMQQQPIP